MVRSTEQQSVGREPDVHAAAEVLLQAERDWEYLSPEEQRGTIDEALNALIERGEMVMESPITDEKYRVTAWINHGDGRHTALRKEPIQDD